MDLLFEEPMELSSNFPEAQVTEEPEAIALSVEHLTPVEMISTATTPLETIPDDPLFAEPALADLGDGLVIDDIEISDFEAAEPADVNSVPKPLQTEFLEENDGSPLPPPPTIPHGDDWDEMPPLELIPVPAPPPSSEEQESITPPDDALIIDLNLD
jgi:hypothetical protein